MREIRTIDEANKALMPYVPLVAQLSGKDTTLDRIRPLMDLLGNPEKKLRIVHIAGTSGKTSTAYFMAGLLQAAGKHVGLTVSPHVDSITERIQLGGSPIAEKAFCQELAQFLEIVDRAPEQPSYFELLYAFALWVFERAKVDYAVVETGMGGLHDATNVAARTDKLCIITDIGYDHTHILGNTLEKIAAQKAGIIHEHNPVIMYRQQESVTAVFEGWSQNHAANLMLTDQAVEAARYGSRFDKHFPAYQQRNWLLAYCAYRFLAVRDKLPSLSQAQLAQTQRVQVPARMDTVERGGKTIVMDGAHNQQKMAAFLISFQREYPGVKPAVLLALKQGKEVNELGPLFAPLAARVIVTTFNTSQDLPARSTDPAEIVQAFKAAGVADIRTIADQRAAYRALLDGPEDICIITGSFYLLSQLRSHENLASENPE